ncbi:MAG: hypothetical protein AAB649_04765, partial [Patescibacteria group bacterium]
MNNINIVLLPSIVFFSLALGGCSRSEEPVQISGGTYLSTSAGASFEQSVATSVAGETIAQFDLGKIHRALTDANTVFMAAGANGMVISEDDAVTWKVIPVSLSTTIDVALLKSGILLAAGIDSDGQ